MYVCVVFSTSLALFYLGNLKSLICNKLVSIGAYHTLGFHGDPASEFSVYVPGTKKL